MHLSRLFACCFLSSTAFAQVAPVADQVPVPVVVEEVAAPKSAASRVSAVTVYIGSALVTREVSVPEGKGTIELVVTPLPSQTVANSLFTEGSDGLRVLSTRCRTRAVREDTRQAVRAREEEIKTLTADSDRIKKEIQVIGQNLEFLQKLENFTGATMQGVAEKGMLNGETTIRLTTFVMDSRLTKATALVELEQKLKANAEVTAFATRQLQELSAGSSRTEFDAVIVVDKANAPASTVRLNYLVGASTWKPQYRFRAGAEKDPVGLEYLAAIEQQSGEDWSQVNITLSTAQPSLNATLPELIPLQIAIVDASLAPNQAAPGFDGAFVAQNRAQAREVRGKAQQAMVGNDTKAGGELLNQAAALDQAEELLAKDDGEKGKGNLEYFAKTVPVLSPRVYRLAKMTNTGDSVILPGEATMYVGTDFVGKMTMPQVAVGEEFTVGFGVDPQLQIGRKLVKKTETAQGGNQVHTYEFRIVLRNYKTIPANLQVWDRLPRAENSEVAVSLSETKPELSTDALYLRNQRPENLLRWDVLVPAGSVGEKVFPVTYVFKMEYAKEMGVQYLGSRGLMEAPIGGMGGMGGGMR
jgi:uncharacterized protein (TIGR02231 family)